MNSELENIVKSISYFSMFRENLYSQEETETL